MTLGRTCRATPLACSASMFHGAARRTRTMSASEDDSEHSSQEASPSCPLTASAVHSPTEARPIATKGAFGLGCARARPLLVRVGAFAGVASAWRWVGLQEGEGTGSPARGSTVPPGEAGVRHRTPSCSTARARRKRAASPRPGVAEIGQHDAAWLVSALCRNALHRGCSALQRDTPRCSPAIMTPHVHAPVRPCKET
jgi:hypothetical protein